jgi:hypothetical protein
MHFLQLQQSVSCGPVHVSHVSVLCIDTVDVERFAKIPQLQFIRS